MKNIIVLLLLGIFCLYGTGFTAEPQPDKKIDKILKEIRQEQGVSKNEEISPDKVSDQKLEELGEAVMDTMYPNHRQHEYMDKMMGGEGSESLSSMHKWMGYNYLSGDNPVMRHHMMGMGGWGKDYKGNRRYFSMMDYGYHMGYGGIFMWLIFLIIILAAVYFIAQSTKSRESGGKTGETALEILKKRYARGEITKEEYDRMKKDLLS